MLKTYKSYKTSQKFFQKREVSFVFLALILLSLVLLFLGITYSALRFWVFVGFLGSFLIGLLSYSVSGGIENWAMKNVKCPLCNGEIKKGNQKSPFLRPLTIGLQCKSCGRKFQLVRDLESDVFLLKDDVEVESLKTTLIRAVMIFLILFVLLAIVFVLYLSLR